MRLHSYVVEHDYGFAPNPFFGVCTLATCKPAIREHSAVGDYVIGTGASKHGRRGFLVFFMKVDEVTTYDKYWDDWRFTQKRPIRTGSLMQFFGDNIYHRDADGVWLQEDSLHSLKDGSPNQANIDHDTQSEKVLIGTEFAYFGGVGPQVPPHLRDFNGVDLVAKRGHKNNVLGDGLRDATIAWLGGLNSHGYIGRPLDWPRQK